MATEHPMQLGMIGLGRMGANLVRRLQRDGHSCVVYDVSKDSVDALVAEGATGAYTLAEFVQALDAPRNIWIMVPAGYVQGTVDDLLGLLAADDTIIDGGNSYYHDDIHRAAQCKEQGVHYVDCGTSGGVWGLDRGFCLMIGGDDAAVTRLDPIFRTIAPGEGSVEATPGRTRTDGTAQDGYLHCGPSGAGHFVKMVHNGIEYGMMAAIAEGLSIIEHADAGKHTQEVDAETTPLRNPEYYQYDIDVAEVAEVWRRGSVVGSWLVDLTADALAKSPDLSKFAGRVSDSGEGRWTVLASIDEGVPAPVITAALNQRFESRGLGEFTGKLLSAMRNEFGGHDEKTADPVSVEHNGHPDSTVVVLFGATGDLAARKLIPGFFRLHHAGLMPHKYRIVGTSPIPMDTDGFRAHAREAVEQFGRDKPQGHSWDAFLDHLDYVISDPPHLGDLATAVHDATKRIGAGTRILHYLSVPPFAMNDVVTAIGASDLAGERTRVILEKPFGTDLDSAKALNVLLHSVFEEEQVFRIDHFLGKEDVQNILAIRFANRLFEPVWSSQHVTHVQIDVPETLGVENRAKFYEETGAFRDMIVTHLFQAMGFVAMETPAGFTADALATEKQRVFDAMLPLDPARVVRGQYAGYRDIPGVADDSDTDTLVAVEARIENERWDGVPFFLRTGKRMPEGRRVITVSLKHAPVHLFPEDVGTRPDQLVFEIGEPGSIRVNFVSKEPGPTMTLGEAHLDFEYRKSFHPRQELEAYERLLHDAMLGERMLFNRAEGVERLWEISAPLLASPPPVQPYEPGTWGPDAIDALVAPHSWYLPD